MLLRAGVKLVYGEAGYRGIAKGPEVDTKTTDFSVAMCFDKRHGLQATQSNPDVKSCIRSTVEHLSP